MSEVIKEANNKTRVTRGEMVRWVNVQGLKMLVERS